MSRLTIDYGIDLGTTNSSIAVFEKTGPRVIRNNENWEFTPSAVWVDKSGATLVGRRAKENAAKEPSNGATEFKLWMGKDCSKTAQRREKPFTPEELSSEVLKSLKEDVRRTNGEDLDAAVITIPAAFDRPEIEATRRAANLAGIVCSPLLQEPIAASLAYGFQRKTDNEFWLVYDIGGRTFDAAVMHVQDGELQVVNHGGDMDLGGRLIDWDLVEQAFVPSLSAFDLPDFRRGNSRWIEAFAKLKLRAEEAKIALSNESTYDFTEDFICKDASGRPVYLNVSVTRRQVEMFAEPRIVRTVNICRDVLREHRLRPADISKVILVGGPTKTPLLRQILEDSKSGLGVSLDFSMDPLTVVAQGAAIFAATQRRPTLASRSTKRGEFVLTLEYQPIENTQQPLVAGRIESTSGVSLAGYAIRILNPQSRPPWESGRLPLQANGSFMTSLHADAGEQNMFQVELYDQSAGRLTVNPSEFPFTVGMVIKDSPLNHDIGIAMANDEVDVLFKKGTPLPCQRKTRHKTVFPIRKGDDDAVLHIPFVEGGDGDHASLNRKIGQVMIKPTDLKYDLPAGSDIEICLQIDASLLITGSATIEVFEKEFPILVEGLVKRGRPLSELQVEFEREEERLQEAVGSEPKEDSTVADVLERLKAENAVGTVERLLNAGDESQAVECEEKIVELRKANQHIEDALAGPRLLAQAKNEIRWAQEVVGDAPAEHQKAFSLLRPEVEAALDGDIGALRRKVEQMRVLRFRILGEKSEYWIHQRDYLLEHKSEMLDQRQAEIWFSHAGRAINQNDIDGLRTACRQLWGFMPNKPETIGYGGGTLRVRDLGV